MKEKLNEDGSELSILNLGPTPHARDFPERFIDGRGTYFRSRTNHWLHTPLLKNCRKPTFYQITPLTDRMNYCSSPINNMGWWMTLEKTRC
jgi:NADH-quinone oxidoreductase subunit D